MKTVVIVCGAGASSTFLAQRIRGAARAAPTAQTDPPMAVIASSLQGLPGLLASSDIVLVGPHLAEVFPAILVEAELAGIVALLLPETIFGADGGERALALINAGAAHRSL